MSEHKKVDLSKIQTRILINNEWVNSTSGKTYPVYNPATDEKLADVQIAGKEDIDKAVNAARKAFVTWSLTSGRERSILINRLADLIEQNMEELAVLESLNTGKPIKTHVMVGDMPQTIAAYRYYAGWADKIMGKTIPIDGNHLAYTKKEPVGVCGQIIPWNWPLMMQAWKFGPALAAGCTVVLKPSQFTPLTALRVGELAIQAGFPPGVINICPGYGSEIGDYIARHPLIDKVAFTGSTDVGKIIQKAATESNLKRVSLELGGKGPHIIFADADLDLAVKNAVHGLFFNMGQNCSAGSRIYVEEPIYDQFLQKAVQVVKSRKIGDPLKDDTEHGPQTTKKQFDKIMEYIKKGQEEGAKLLTGGKRWGDKGLFIEPTIFADVEDNMKIATDEIFGPVMVILKFTDAAEVIKRANNSIYGLTAGVQSKDVGKAMAVAGKIQAGTVWINTYNKFDAALPFGGYKESGVGRELGPYGLLNYIEVKSVCVSLEPVKDILTANPFPTVSSQ
jgi:aldehyde dehydrogenase (NAD+)